MGSVLAGLDVVDLAVEIGAQHLIRFLIICILVIAENQYKTGVVVTVLKLVILLFLLLVLVMVHLLLMLCVLQVFTNMPFIYKVSGI